MRTKFGFYRNILWFILSLTTAFGFIQISTYAMAMPQSIALDDSYPTPSTIQSPEEPSEPSASMNYLPLIVRPQDNYYAQGVRSGEVYYGVWANITTADPKIREPLFSYASIDIISSDHKWVETGWMKSMGTNCLLKFVW